MLPAPAETRVERDELIRCAHLCGRVLLRQVILLSFGVDDVEIVGQSAIVSLRREAHGALTGAQCIAQIPEAILLRRIAANGVVHSWTAFSTVRL